MDRMERERLNKRIYESEVEGRRRGRPSWSWRDGMEKYLNESSGVRKKILRVHCKYTHSPLQCGRDAWQRWVRRRAQSPAAGAGGAGVAASGANRRTNGEGCLPSGTPEDVARTSGGSALKRERESSYVDTITLSVRWLCIGRLDSNVSWITVIFVVSKPGN